MPQPEAFWDRHAAGYAKSKISDMPAYEKTLDRTAAYLEPHHRVLEVGCGTGTTALHHAPRVDSILGTDISGKMAEIAQGKADAAGQTNARFRRAPADQTQPEGPFDVVLALNLLHLLPGWPRTLDQLRAHVAPGGLLISKTPCVGESFFGLRWMVNVMRAVGYAPFVEYLRIDQLDAAIKKAGFEILETGQYQKGMPARFVVARRIG